MFRTKSTNKVDKNKDSINDFLESNYQVNPINEALYVTLIYGFFGMLWIALSDRILYMIIDDLSLFRQIQTYKGWIYVLVTMGLIYTLVRSRSTLFQKALNTIRQSYEDLEATHEELVASDEELINQTEFTENMINNAPVIIAAWNDKGEIIRINPYGLKLLGYSQDEMFGRMWAEFLSGNKDEAVVIETLKQIQKNSQLKNIESKFMTKDKKEVTILWNSSIIKTKGLNQEIVSVGTDITSRKLLEEKLRDMAYFDMLTKLPNRAMLETEIKVLIREQTPFALAYIDIDNFKYINDTLGHSVGDEFLKYIAKCIRSYVKEPDLVTRISGDEFAIILKGSTNWNEIKATLEDLSEYLGKTWSYNHHEFFISLSIGVVLYPENGFNHEHLVKNADIAMYKAKKAGKGRIVFYTEDILIENQINVHLVNRLQYAIENNLLMQHYQPQIELNSEKIIGLEALVRWHDKEYGFVSPASFISLAEETGQIYAIEKWVFRTALEQKKQFEEQGLEDISISINLSSKTLTSDTNFFEIESLIASYNLNFKDITIEITETAILSNMDFVISRLHNLKKLGVRIALDDFGTGYSSLTYLKNLPIDIIKLDRSFIKSLEENSDSKDAKIIKSVISLANALGYEVVAEGIESKAQLNFLVKNNCPKGQGYLFSKPVAVEEIMNLLEQPVTNN
ncbi:putative bifunctional diguanylate cyclase/phosphodiesterase [Desulfuribacillus alkaliarsenatis]|uniref:Diguanylate cyclase n=1 Tax=Desulfuribacillus alkaliarsenatis TaxID=766136 RepID=A0A1E5G5E6_9FIRM|nr:EAL domain-containing protein [Desulfuribacillus alkaliarsenatis]OEF98383.1 hypothetical protein BHF68_01515 [Desulfuribacillus alkaliarsenatis]